jgi:hypothetical protein
MGDDKMATEIFRYLLLICVAAAVLELELIRKSLASIRRMVLANSLIRDRPAANAPVV